MRQVVVFKHFSKMAGGVLAIIQILLGLTLAALQGVGVYSEFELLSTHLGATGIWAGVFVILSGIAGIIAIKFRTPGAIASFMVCSVLATLVAPAVAVTSVISFMRLDDYCKVGTITTTCNNFELKKILEIALIIVAVVEYCFGASCVITCCWTLYCDPAGYQVEYIQSPSGKQRKTIELQDKYDQVSEDVNFPTIIEEEEPGYADSQSQASNAESAGHDSVDDEKHGVDNMAYTSEVEPA